MSQRCFNPFHLIIISIVFFLGISACGPPRVYEDFDSWQSLRDNQSSQVRIETVETQKNGSPFRAVRIIFPPANGKKDIEVRRPLNTQSLNKFSGIKFWIRSDCFPTDFGVYFSHHNRYVFSEKIILLDDKWHQLTLPFEMFYRENTRIKYPPMQFKLDEHIPLKFLLINEGEKQPETIVEMGPIHLYKKTPRFKFW